MSRRHHYFTLEEANALIPTLEHYFREVALLLRTMRGLRDTLQAGGAILSTDGIQLPRGSAHLVVQAREDYMTSCHAHDAIMDELLHMGVDVIDVDAGIVNFYCWWDGEEVVLNWQFGEPAIQFWIEPGTTEGKRQSLRQLLGDVPGHRVMQH